VITFSAMKSLADSFPPVRGLQSTHALLSGGSLYVDDDHYVEHLERAGEVVRYPAATERPAT
jgi:hypothetical protein